MGEEEHKLGIRASSTRQVFFNETKVPVENISEEEMVSKCHERFERGTY
jgi:alkylation response protein AidB-like acyl-CoA dehydrogenase